MRQPILPVDAKLRDAVHAIEKTRRLFAAVVGADGELLGILSDGDIRRAILAGKALDDPAADVMTRSPITGPAAARDDELLDRMLSLGVAAMPVIDADGKFVRVVQVSDFAGEGAALVGGEGYAAAVIMAGGEGRRLRPLTLHRPKPMLDFGGVPLLERQVRAMVKCGLKRIFIATNYLGHMIESHFGEGREFGAEIRYLRERQRLGTAGALSLLPDRLDGPLLVINGDVITGSDFGKLLAFHRETEADITVAAVIYRVEIPFGVLQIEGTRALGVEEKPSQSFLCNGGIYVLDGDTLALVPQDTKIDMTDVISTAIVEGMKVSVFPIHEYWSDIGSPADLKQALSQFQEALPL